MSGTIFPCWSIGRNRDAGEIGTGPIIPHVLQTGAILAESLQYWTRPVFLASRFPARPVFLRVPFSCANRGGEPVVRSSELAGAVDHRSIEATGTPRTRRSLWGWQHRHGSCVSWL